MARSFVPVDRDQVFLLPPDMRDWLASDHLVWFLIDLVGRLDLGRFDDRYRLGAQGRAPYDPAMLLTLLLYAYSQGLRSSRRIERACRQDVAYKVICGSYGNTPDHVTICRFRQNHQDDIEAVFVQVLMICDRLGMLPLGVIAVDGTKLDAQASMGANRSLAAMRAEVAATLAEAGAVDAEENDRFGASRGDKLPAEMVDGRSRLAHLRDAIAYAEAALAEREADFERRRAAQEASGLGGPRLKAPSMEIGRLNVTDPDTRVMHTADGGFLQGYNGQIASSECGLVLASRVTSNIDDLSLLGVMLDAVIAMLRAAGIDRNPAALIADAGYLATDDIDDIDDRYNHRDATDTNDDTNDDDTSDDDTSDDANAGGSGDAEPLTVLVATAKRRDRSAKTPDGKALEQLAAAEADLAAAQAERRAEQQRRASIHQRVADGEIDINQGAREAGITLANMYGSYAAWKRGGVEAVPFKLRKTLKPPPRSKVIIEEMNQRFADPTNRGLYRRRSHLVETPIAWMMNRGARRLHRRGLPGAEAEFLFEATLNNILRVHSTITAASTTLQLRPS